MRNGLIFLAVDYPVLLQDNWPRALAPDWNRPDRTVCLSNMRQVADRPWGLAALVSSAVTIVVITLLLAFSLGVFTLISLEAAVCTFSAALAPATCS